jgi:hypothetical protein
MQGLREDSTSDVTKKKNGTKANTYLGLDVPVYQISMPEKLEGASCRSD